MQIVTSMTTLFQLAKKEGKAKLSGDKEAYEKAKEEHEAYKQLCLKSDKIIMSSDIGTNQYKINC